MQSPLLDSSSTNSSGGQYFQSQQVRNDVNEEILIYIVLSNDHMSKMLINNDRTQNKLYSAFTIVLDFFNTH